MKNKLIVALGLAPLQLLSAPQEVRAYKTDDRTAKWCVVIATPEKNEDDQITHGSVSKISKNRIISESKFKANTDYLPKKIKFDFSKDTSNMVYVYPNPDCVNQPIPSSVHASELNTNVTRELRIDKDGEAEIVDEGQEPSKLKKYKVKVVKTDKNTQDKKWTIKAFTKKGADYSEISSVSIKKDTSGFSKDLEIAINGETYIDVYNERNELIGNEKNQVDVKNRDIILLNIDGSGNVTPVHTN